MIIQSQTHRLRPQTTAHLAQTMSLLELTGVELRQKIESELASNPALELVQEVKCPNCHRVLSDRGSCPVCSQPKKLNSDQPIIFVSPRSSFNQFDSIHSNEDIQKDDWAAAVEDLPMFVLRQISTELDPKDRPIAAHILSSLDDDGLLSIPIIEIANYHHKPITQVEKVLRLIQRAEPVGVGSPSPQQALLIQLDVLSESRKIPAHAKEAIKDGMGLLSRRAYTDLGNLLEISTREARDLAIFISKNLNPYPARAHWGDIHYTAEAAPTYQTPDIIITRLNNSPHSPLIVEILSPFSGYLRINPLFRKALAQAPRAKAEQWQADADSATLLVKCIQQRNNTMVRLLERLVILQRQFILEGDAFLLPITRARFAGELEVHESTVSRAVANKAVQLPNRRIIPLAKLFDRSLHIRTALKQIIEQEVKPLSDTQIADLLIDRGYSIARRTVAKYRSMEGILPARLRRSNLIPNL